jgi:hypothetical protein
VACCPAKSFTIGGEAVALGLEPRFEELSHWEAARTAIHYAFDLIEHAREDLRNLPFLDRKAALVRLLRATEARHHVQRTERALSRKHIGELYLVLARRRVARALHRGHEPESVAVLRTAARICSSNAASNAWRLRCAAFFPNTSPDSPQ